MRLIYFAAAGVLLAGFSYLNFPEERVLSLDLGACWAQRIDDPADPGWKIASFSDSVTSTILERRFLTDYNDRLREALRELKSVFPNFPASRLEFFLACSGAGHFVKTRVTGGPVPLCVWSKLPSREREPFLAIYPDPEADAEGAGADRAEQACSGIERRSLIVLAKEPSDTKALKKLLKRRYRHPIDRIDAIETLGILILRLDRDFDFREKQFREQLEADPVVMAQVRHVGYSRILSTRGQELFILSGEFPDFLGTR